MDNARFKEQAEVMQRYIDDGVCPFCPGTQAETLKPVLIDGNWWTVRENRWPYQNTKFHFLLILKEHHESLSSVPPSAGAELFDMIGILEQRYEIESGAVAVRFGDIRFNGGTVSHIHAHLVVIDITDELHPDYRVVRFKMGSASKK